MDKSDIHLLFAYNRWANAHVRAACRSLTDEQMRQPALCSFGSLIGTLAHVYGAEHSWRLRLEEGVSIGKLPTAADFPTYSGLEIAWEAEEARMEAFIARLDGASLESWVEYTTTSGKPQGSTLWRALLHVVIHGAQFRGEAGAVMAALGQSPGDLDMVRFLREIDQR